MLITYLKLVKYKITCEKKYNNRKLKLGIQLFDFHQRHWLAFGLEKILYITWRHPPKTIKKPKKQHSVGLGPHCHVSFKQGEYGSSVYPPPHPDFPRSDLFRSGPAIRVLCRSHLSLQLFLSSQPNTKKKTQDRSGKHLRQREHRKKIVQENIFALRILSSDPSILNNA